MRKKIVAGNWKMNKTIAEGKELIMAVISQIQQNKTKLNASQLQIIFAPPFLHLAESVNIIEGNPYFAIAAQNCHHKDKGAFTGEIAAPMLAAAGVTHVIIGHSERRQYFGETNALLAEKINIALSNKLTPIYCIGETLDERNKNIHFNIIKEQLETGVFALSPDNFKKIILAYEPVWAIGTGVTATSQQAQEMHAFIRKQIEIKYDKATAEETTILYGGSCNAKNAQELFANTDVDGGLIGGASLIADDFVKIIHSF